MKRILFPCVANSARSQMAEGLARRSRRVDALMPTSETPADPATRDPR